MAAELSPLDAALLRYLDVPRQQLEPHADILAKQGVALLAAHRLRKHLPDAAATALRTAATPYLLATMRTDELAARLRALAVPHVVLKGPALGSLWRLRDGADLRTYTDLDLLVCEGDVERVTAELVAAGMTLGPQTQGEVAMVDATGASLDLHWLLINDTQLITRFRLHTQLILAQHVHWTGTSGALDAELTLLHTILHAAVSDLSRLAAFHDVDAAARNPALDWANFAEVARKHRLGLMAAVGLRRARRWAGTPMPSSIPRQLAPGSPWAAMTELLSRRPPDRYLKRGWSGGEFFRHTRENSWRSVLALAQDASLNVSVQRQLRRRAREAA